jgi:electron transfer flavoprotein alpha subunit
MTQQTIGVIARDPQTAAELVAGARGLSEQVDAVALGNADVTETAQAAADQGATTVLAAQIAEGKLPEAYAFALAALLAERAPRLVIFGSTVTDRLLAGIVASRLNTSAQAATGVRFEEDTPVITSMVFGGTAVATRRLTSPIAVITVGTGALESAAPPAAPGVIEQIALDAQEPGYTVLETLPKQGETVNLASAKKVLGVGRGFAAQTDLGMAQELASTLGAELACSRPITEGENWMARERYIGVSGVMLKPDLYFAIGISGQVQHMVGINQAKTIIAINKDKNAPIFKQVDVGIVGDLYQVLPALSAALSRG